MKIFSWVFGCKNIPLFGHGNMGVYFGDIDGTMSQHFLNIADIHICFQKAGGEGVPQHMGCDMQFYGGKGSVFVDRSADRLIR